MANVPILYLLKAPDNQRFTSDFWGNKMISQKWVQVFQNKFLQGNKEQKDFGRINFHVNKICTICLTNK